MPKTALVTGSASGLGLEFAKLLAADSYNLLLVDINAEKLAEARQMLLDKFSVNVRIFRVDLGQPQAASEVYQKINGSQVDVLINNAGFGLNGPFAKTDWEHESAMLQLHVVTSTHLTKLILNDMVAKGSGKILNVSSVAAFIPGPFMAIYYATKAYILSFSQALANELKGTGITVTTLCPGQTRTGFQQLESVLSASKPSGTKYFTSEADDVAACGYKALKAGRSLAIPGFANKMVMLLSRILPRKLSVTLVRKIQENARGK